MPFPKPRLSEIINSLPEAGQHSLHQFNSYHAACSRKTSEFGQNYPCWLSSISLHFFSVPCDIHSYLKALLTSSGFLLLQPRQQLTSACCFLSSTCPPFLPAMQMGGHERNVLDAELFI